MTFFFSWKNRLNIRFWADVPKNSAPGDESILIIISEISGPWQQHHAVASNLNFNRVHDNFGFFYSVSETGGLFRFEIQSCDAADKYVASATITNSSTKFFNYVEKISLRPLYDSRCRRTNFALSRALYTNRYSVLSSSLKLFFLFKLNYLLHLGRAALRAQKPDKQRKWTNTITYSYILYLQGRGTLRQNYSKSSFLMRF